MLDIQICNLRQAGRLYKSWATKTLSITNVGDWGEAGFPLFGPNHWVAEFDDIVDASNPAAPNRDRMSPVMAFASVITPSDRVLVHCSAGVSRSPAVAIVLQVMHGLGPLEAVKETHRVRPQMKPNELVIGVADDILGLNGSLLDVVLDWRRASLFYDLGDLVD